MDTVLGRLKEISSAVMFAAEASDLDVVLGRIARAARELVQSRYAALGVPDGKGGLRFFETSGMTPEEIARLAHPPRGHGLIGAIMKERKPIRLPRIQDDARSHGFPPNHPPMSTFLGVPIISGNHLYGMLYLTEKEQGGDFTENDQALIEALAGYAALAIVGAELTDQQSRLRLLEERERIGMQLHDGIIQSLYGIGMQVDILRRTQSPITHQQLDMVVDSLNDVIEDIRSFIGNLRKRHAQESVLVSFTTLKERLHPPDHIAIRIDAPDTQPPFAGAAFESICLIVNEALSNAIRHSGASQIEVRVEEGKSLFSIMVEDNGHGFEVDKVSEGEGLGLKNMRQRARMFGGKVIINSLNNKGTRLSIVIPIGTY